MKYMKVVMITPYRPERDGVGDCSVSLVPEMLSIKKGLKVVIVSHDIGPRKKERGVHQIIYKKSVTRKIIPQLTEELRSLPRTFKDLDKTLEIIRKEKPDIVHIQHEPGVFNLFYAPMLLKKLKSMGIKSVLTLHGRDYSLLKPFHQTMLYPYADLITVHTDVHRKTVRGKNVAIVPMGINKIKSGPLKFYDNVLFFGFMSPYKTVEYLVHAFRKVLVKVPHARLMINGPVNPAHIVETVYRNKILKMIRDFGLSSKTDVVTEYVDRNKLPSIKSNIVVFPYAGHYSAGQSAAILDSIAAGKAVIATRIPGIFERLENGRNGFIVEPESSDAIADAIVKLLKNKSLLKKICRNNLAKAKVESWREVAKVLLKSYDELLRR